MEVEDPMSRLGLGSVKALGRAAVAVTTTLGLAAGPRWRFANLQGWSHDLVR